MDRMKIIIAAFVILPCLSLPVAAQDMEFVSSTLHHNRYNSIGKVGEYVYCGGRYGIHIFDITDPANPDLVKICDFPDIFRMFIDGDYAFLLSRSLYSSIPELRVLNTSDPLNPQIISDLSMINGSYNILFEYYNFAIYVFQDRADTLNHSRIKVIDISDPYNPILSGSLTVEAWVPSMWASDGYLHVLTSEFDFWENYWMIYSVSNSGNPALVYSIDFGEQFYVEKVATSLNYAYLNSYSGVHIYDFTIPSNPFLVRIDSSSNFPDLITVHDTVGYARTTNGIGSYDMSDPVYPVQIGYVSIPYGVGSFFYSGDTCFTATARSWSYDDASKFNIIDFSDLNNPAVIGEYWTPGKSYDVQLRGDYAYIANGSSGLTTVDISDPVEPEIINILETAEYARDILIQGNRLYLLRGYRFEIYDISDPTQPLLLGFYSDYLGEPHHFFIDSTYAYLSKTPNNSPGFLLILDISNPTNPIHAYTIENLNFPNYIHVLNGYAYIGCRYDLEIYDVSNLDSISHISSYHYNHYAYQFDIAFPNVIAACQSTAVEIVDVSDPENPYFVGDYDSLSANRITIIDNFAILKRSNFLYLMDVSNPESPILVSSFSSHMEWYSSEEVSVRDGYIYNAANSRFQILRLTPTGIEEVSSLNLGNFSLPQNYPNPFNASTTISYSLPKPSDIRIEIYDILGRKVETLFSGAQAAGNHAINWNPGNVSSGVYYYRVESEEYKQTRNCLLIK